MVLGNGNIDVNAVLKQAVIKILNVFARGATLFDFIVTHSGSKLRTGEH